MVHFIVIMAIFSKFKSEDKSEKMKILYNFSSKKKQYLSVLPQEGRNSFDIQWSIESLLVLAECAPLANQSSVLGDIHHVEEEF